MIGPNRARWHLGLPVYGRVVYRHAWPGVDVAFHGAGSRLEYDLEVRPGADPSRIALRVPGAHLGRNGSLVAGRFRQLAPRAFQWIGGHKRAVASRYSRRAGGVGIALANYDRSRPLVIDPVLTYSTYLGGSAIDVPVGIDVGADGSAYVVGVTTSTGAAPNGFPTKPGPPYQGVNLGGGDAFVTRLSPAGDSLVYSTYFGGTGADIANGVAVDAAGDAFFAGYTTSTGSGSIPTQNPYQGANAGGEDAFVAELDPAGTQLLYSTYFGGSDRDYANAIALDAGGHPHIVGYTASADFPHNDRLIQSQFGGGQQDAFVAILSGGGSTLPLSTYLGGDGRDQAYGVAVDSGGNTYVTGDTNTKESDSRPFPLKNAYQPKLASVGGATNAFVSKLDPVGDLIYSTYLGGTGFDTGTGVAVDASGRAFVTGRTQSTNFPTKNPIDGTGDTHQDVFVTELAASGQTLVGSTYLGASAGFDTGNAIAAAPGGGVWVAGYTTSPAASPFPVKNAVQPSFGGSSDAFATHLSAGLTSIESSTYLGGGNGEEARGVAVDASGAAYVTGTTNSSGNSPFPTVSPFQPAFAGGDNDAFIAKLSPAPPGGGGNNGGSNNGGGGNPGGSGTAAAPRCIVRKLTVPKARRLRATITCDLAAKVTLSLTARVPKRTKPLSLGNAHAGVRAGGIRKNVFVTLSRGNYARLVALRKLRVRARLVATGAGGKRVRTRTLTVRAPHK